jgi:hypothetical protein
MKASTPIPISNIPEYYPSIWGYRRLFRLIADEANAYKYCRCDMRFCSSLAHKYDIPFFEMECILDYLCRKKIIQKESPLKLSLRRFLF